MCYWDKIEIGGGSGINNKIPARKLTQQVLVMASRAAVPETQACDKMLG